jgi:hypothetical protein
MTHQTRDLVRACGAELVGVRLFAQYAPRERAAFAGMGS